METAIESLQGMVDRPQMSISYNLVERVVVERIGRFEVEQAELILDVADGVERTAEAVTLADQRDLGVEDLELGLPLPGLEGSEGCAGGCHNRWWHSAEVLQRVFEGQIGDVLLDQRVGHRAHL